MTYPEAIVRAMELYTQAQLEMNSRIIWQVPAILGGIGLMLLCVLLVIFLIVKITER